MGKLIQNYSLQSELGSGVYSKVYRAINTITKQEVAVKMIRAQKFKEIPKLETGIINQINILTNIQKCPHIVTYYDMLKTPNNFYFVYEYCNEGTLEMLLRKVGKLPQKQAGIYMRQMLQAFRILAKYNIMHRDIKPENILMHNGVVKLADFGFCKPLESSDAVADTMLGSPVYMAPEVLKGQVYSIKADVWSLGVVFYRIVFGYCPFQSSNIAQLINTVKSEQVIIPSNVISHDMESLIRKMLTKDHNQRMDWSEVFKYEISEDGVVTQPKVLLQIKSKMKGSGQNFQHLNGMKGSQTGSIQSSSEKVQIKVSCKTSFSNSTSDYQKNPTTSNYTDSPQKFRFGCSRTVSNSNKQSFRRIDIQSPRTLDVTNHTYNGYGFHLTQGFSPTPNNLNLKLSQNAFQKHNAYGSQSNHSQKDQKQFQNKSFHYGCSSGSSDRFSKINVSIKSRTKCMDIITMAIEIAKYSYCQALILSHHLSRVVQSELVSISESLKKEVKTHYNSPNFNYQLHEEFINSIQEQLTSLKYALYAYSDEIPDKILKDSIQSDPKINLRKLVDNLKLENIQELILISQIIDYIEQKMLIKKSTYEKLTKQQIVRQVKSKLSKISLTQPQIG